MFKLKSFMTILAIIIVGGYLGITLEMYLLQDRLIFFPQKLTPTSLPVISFKADEIMMESNSVTLHGWLLNRGEAKLIIYYGGNGDELSHNIPDLNNIEGYSILLLNYRGYGLSEGKPGEAALFEDALNAYDHITAKLNIAPEHIVLMGRSLGSGVATYVASQRPVSKLILVTPFDSVERIAKNQFPILPVGLILKHRFNSLEYAKSITCPALFIIAGGDRTIPNSHSMNLANNWRGEHEVVRIDQADHNDISDYEEYWQAIEHFLNRM